MKYLDWTQYGTEVPQVSEYPFKMFKVDRDHIYFSSDMKFSMNVANFLVCCENANDLAPVKETEVGKEIQIGTDDNHTVWMTRYVGTPDKIEVRLRGDDNWNSWIRFTVEEMTTILETIMRNENLSTK